MPKSKVPSRKTDQGGTPQEVSQGGRSGGGIRAAHM